MYPYDYRCRIIDRINRFVIYAENIDTGVKGYAFTNNTGRLKEYLSGGKRGYCRRRVKPGKTQYRLFAVEDLYGMAALIDTQLQMKAFEEMVGRGMIPWLRDCSIARRNPRLGSSVLDYLLNCSGERLFIEIKSAVFRGDRVYAMYPDCPTLRGRRHIRELMDLARRGGRGAIIFIAGLPGVKAFKPYGEGDPEIPRLLREAVESGVSVRAINIYYDPNTRYIVLVDPDLPVELD